MIHGPFHSTLRAGRRALLAVTGFALALSPIPAHATLAPCSGPYDLSARSAGETVRVEWRGERCSGRLEIGGDVRWDEAMHLERLAPGAFVRGEEKVGRAVRRLSVRPGDGGAPVVSWSVDGEEAAFDAGARAWLGERTLLLARQTGYRAGERVARLLEAGGMAALVAEVAEIDNDRVEALYVEMALGGEGLGGEDRASLVAAAARHVSSDGVLADLLTAVVNRGTADLESVAAASRAIGSDGDRSRVLTVGLSAAVHAPERTALLRAAAGVGSDGDLSQLLVSAVDRFDLADAGERRAFAAAVATVGSDGDRTRVLAALAGRDDLPPAALALLLDSAAGIGSDGDLARLLVTVAGRHKLEGDLRRAYLRTAEGIGSEGDRRRAVEAL